MMNRKSSVSWDMTCAGSKLPAFTGNVLPSSFTVVLEVTLFRNVGNYQTTRFAVT